MNQIKIYQVDAFAEKVFTGNPAAVCPLYEWLPDEKMQLIAMENNLAETAFVNLNTHPYEFDSECENWEFYDIHNGKMLNCYPEYRIFQDELLLKTLREL